MFRLDQCGVSWCTRLLSGYLGRTVNGGDKPGHVAAKNQASPIAQTWKLPLPKSIASMLIGDGINVPDVRFH